MNNTNVKQLVSYRRISTAKQKRVKFGFEAQDVIIKHFASLEGEIVAEYIDVYRDKELSECVELRKAMDLCKQKKLTLIIAETSQLRNFIEALQIYEELEGRLICCDIPLLNEFMLDAFFSIAERKSELISLWTKSALHSMSKRGELVGGSYGVWNKNSGMIIDESRAYRENVILEKAREASSKAAIERANANPHNVAFKLFILDHIATNGAIGAYTNWEEIAERLNERNLKTATGLEFTALNARSMWHNNKHKILYNF